LVKQFQITLALFLLTLAPAFAQGPAPASGSGRVEHVVKTASVPRLKKIRPPSTYRIHPGDELELDIFSLPAQEKKYTVRVDGRFYLSTIGEVQAAGLTLEELRFVLHKRLGRELKNSTFQLGLTNYSKREISVLGEVRSQGKFAIVPGSTVLDMVALAGGLSDKADPDSATLLRSGKEITVSLKPSASESQQVALRVGDILYIHAGNRISVAGEVQKPGVYAVSRDSKDPISDALADAGGVKSTGAVHRIKLIRPAVNEPMVIDASPATNTAVAPESRILKDGDTLVVPIREAIVLGSVAKQGYIPLEGGEGLIEVVSSGGLNADADLGHVTVVRAKDVHSGGEKRENYNIKDYFKPKKGKPGEKPPKVEIFDGDVVYVPAKSTNNAVSSLSQFGSLIFLLKAIVP
jgi:polysaccharide export outer membrane protein